MQSVKRRPVWALLAILLAAAAVFSGCAKRSVDASVPSPEPSYAQSEIENALSGSVQEALALFEKQQEGADGAAQNFPKTSVSAAALGQAQSAHIIRTVGANNGAVDIHTLVEYAKGYGYDLDIK